MNTLQDFFENAKAKNLCDRGAKIWEHCGSKKALMDFALGSWGCDYVATAIAQGWGISPESISKDFASFNNGRYTRDKDGYTSQMYCQTESKEIEIKSTLTLIIDFDGVVKVDRPCELYIVNSKCAIVGDGIPLVYAYNSEVEHPNLPIKVMENNKY